MIRRTMLVAIVGLVALGVGLIGNALATTPSGFTAETARGPLVDRPLDVNWKFDPRAKSSSRHRARSRSRFSGS